MQEPKSENILPKVYGRLPSNKVADFIYTLLASTFLWFYTSLYRLRESYRHVSYRISRRKYTNITPQQVRTHVAELPKIPQHVGFILNYNDLNGFKGVLEAATEVCAWTLGAGSSRLTIYERTGCLKREDLQSLADVFTSSLRKYFGRQNVPHIIFRKGREYVEAGDVGDTALTVQFLSECDGKPFMVDLAKEFSLELAQGNLKEEDITIERIHKLTLERVGDEPDLMVTFNSYLDLEGFSPWLARICELYCLPDNDNNFGFQVFMEALKNFANVKVNLGS